MSETVDEVATDETLTEPVVSDEAAAGADEDDAADVEGSEVEEAEQEASELLEQVGRNASTLVLREVQLATSHHIPELLRASRDIAVALGVGIAFTTAFALGNWAIVDALSSSLPGWRAPLVLAAVWVVVGGLLAVFVLVRTGHLLGWRWWRALSADPDEAVREREQARDEAQQAMRESLQQFAGAVAREAGALVTIAVVPLAGGAADAGEKVIGAVDDMTDAIEENVPGGGVINRVADVALMPGRFAISVMNKGLKRDGPENEPAKE